MADAVPEAALDAADLLARLKSYEGMELGISVAQDPVNQAMIRHWVEAMGDENPVYTDARAAAGSVHQQIIAPPTMLQAWTMRGYRRHHGPGAAEESGDDGPTPHEEVTALLDAAGFTSVVATNCEQEYVRMLHLGDHLQMRAVLDDISEEKHTALGIGHFVTQLMEYSTLDGELVATQRWRILKFKPGTGRTAAAKEPTAAETAPRPLRPRPAVTLDNAFWFDGAREHRLLIQRCAGCGTLRHPPRPRCDRCGSYEWTAVEASGRGTVYSYVVNHQPQVPAFDYPLPIALVELEEGTRLVADLVGVEPAEIQIGMPVTVEWIDHDPDLSLPAFRPADDLVERA
jgi:3-oxo-4,17-pregnadiene-20-carboxyl-CoA hydratase alpha subunit